jgi:hypothetical protein
MKMELTECSETSAYKIQTPGNYPEENTQHTEHGESLKSKIWEYWSLLNVLLRILKIWLFSQYDGTSDNLPRYYAKPEAACAVLGS